MRCQECNGEGRVRWQWALTDPIRYMWVWHPCPECQRHLFADAISLHLADPGEKTK